MYEHIRKNHLKMSKHRGFFYETFGADIDNYFDIKTGFNLVKFDADLIHSVGGMSIKAMTRKLYGGHAVDLVLELLK